MWPPLGNRVSKSKSRSPDVDLVWASIGAEVVWLVCDVEDDEHDDDVAVGVVVVDDDGFGGFFFSASHLEDFDGGAWNGQDNTWT